MAIYHFSAKMISRAAGSSALAAAAYRSASRLDDGRSVAFDVKDYADIDHGYAATVHKGQGVTVDRVHVLATPGLDRHAAYVALSRHRERVDLHYGRDDFVDQGKLVRTLARVEVVATTSGTTVIAALPSGRFWAAGEGQPPFRFCLRRWHVPTRAGHSMRPT
jgi:hypothetical protein